MHLTFYIVNAPVTVHRVEITFGTPVLFGGVYSLSPSAVTSLSYGGCSDSEQSGGLVIMKAILVCQKAVFFLP